MPYRDDAEPLQERFESLTKALDDVRAQSHALGEQEASLAKELEDVRVRLEPARRHLPLANVRIATSLLGTGACALLGLAAIARVMTSEISPIAIGPSTTYIRAPVTPPVAPQPLATASPTSAAPISDDGVGFVWVEAPPGTRIYENERYLGTAPFMTPMPEGTHVLRAIERKMRKEKTVAGHVRGGGVTTFIVDFAANEHKVERKPAQVQGKRKIDPGGAPTNTL